MAIQVGNDLRKSVVQPLLEAGSGVRSDQVTRALPTWILKNSEGGVCIYSQEIGQEIICFLREEKTMQLAICIRPKKVIRKISYLKTLNVGVVHQRPLN